MEKKTIAWWVVFILLCIWQLPQLLIGLIMWPFLGTKRLIADRHFNLCFEGENMSGGISLGPIAYVSKYLAKKPESIAHEVDGHTMQSKILGWAYLPTVGIFSLIHAWIGKGCYYFFWTESWANKCAGLYVDEYCHLHFIK